MSATTETSADAAAVQPFTIPVASEAELEALRARITATRWPDPELVADFSQGVQQAVTQELARYWATEYGWTSTSSTSARRTRTRCRSSSPTGGPARSSSC